MAVTAYYHKTVDPYLVPREVHSYLHILSRVCRFGAREDREVRSSTVADAGYV